MNKQDKYYKIEVAVICTPWTTFSYLYHSKITEGTRVQVPFGPRQQLGIVINCSKKPEPEDHHHINTPQLTKITLKHITMIVDQTPLFSKSLIELAYFLSKYYFHPIGEVFKTMHSAILTKQQENWIYTIDRTQINSISNDKYTVNLIDKLFQKRNQLTEKTIKIKIKKLSTNLQQQKKALKTLNQLVLSSKNFLQKTLNPKTYKEIHSKKSSVLILTQPLLKLNPQQYTIFSTISQKLDQGFFKPWLLHGVTASGKTQIYIHLAYSLLSKNYHHQILILVPEIALTPQTTKIFHNYFGDLVASYHSVLSPKKRAQIFENLKSNHIKILIGARSALFAPFNKLALIIVDEEHDNSYKQQSNFLYHARDSAIMRAKYENCMVILGSATPSLESYYAAITGKYQLVLLTKKAISSKDRKTVIIPSKPLTQKGRLLTAGSKLSAQDLNETHISPKIIEMLRKNYFDGFQSMVLIQRRGYYHCLVDAQTHHTVKCPNCSLSYYLHLYNKVLICHFCDNSIDLDSFFRQNQDKQFFAMGCGSEKAFDFIKKSIPSANIARLDSDIPSKTTELPRIINDFNSGIIDILVGTQMIAKGHDFPKVTLVALIEIDDLLRLADFRASERTFQIIVQASGRSGRGENPGSVVIQSSRSNNLLISYGLENNYQQFVNDELNFRFQYNYPPFSRIVLIRFQHCNIKILEQFCSKLANFIITIEPSFNGRILGPAIPYLSTLSGYARRQLMLISSSTAQLHNTTKTLLSWIEENKPRSIEFQIDVDPTNLI